MKGVNIKFEQKKNQLSIKAPVYDFFFVNNRDKYYCEHKKIA